MKDPIFNGQKHEEFLEPFNQSELDEARESFIQSLPERKIMSYVGLHVQLHNLMETNPEDMRDKVDRVLKAVFSPDSDSDLIVDLEEWSEPYDKKSN